MGLEIQNTNSSTQLTPMSIYSENLPLDKFVSSVLNRVVPASDIRENRMANNAKYIPISFVEARLDEIYQGIWSHENFQTKVVANEIIGSIELKVFHPIAKVWLTRVGTASVVIQQNAWLLDEQGNPVKDNRGEKIKNKPKPSDVDAKISNTLVKDIPHLKAECVKNAAKSLGVWFGRDLNRKDADNIQSDLPLIASVAKKPTASDVQFKALLTKIEREGLQVIEGSRMVFSFTEAQEIELSNIAKNGK